MLYTPPTPTPSAGALVAANNLSDLASAAAARANLEVLSAAEVNPRLAARAPLSGVQVTTAGLSGTQAQLGTGSAFFRWCGVIPAWSQRRVIFGSSRGQSTFTKNTWAIGSLGLTNIEFWEVGPVVDSPVNEVVFGTAAALTNRVVELLLVKDSVAGTVSAYVDGQLVGSAATTIAVDLNLTTSSLFVGRASAFGDVYPSTTMLAEYGNVALSAAEVALLHAYGWAALPQYVHDAGGETVIFTANFSAGTDSFTDQSGVSPVLSGNNDGVGPGGDLRDDCFRALSDSATDKVYLKRVITGYVSQKRYRMAFDYYAEVGAFSGSVFIRDQEFITAGVPLVEGSWQSVEIEWVSKSNGAGFVVNNTTNTTAVSSLADTKSFYFRNFRVTTAGLCGSWTFDGTGAGYQEHDRSGGRRPLFLSTTGVSRLQRGDRIQVTVTEAHTGAGNRQLTGQSVLPDLGWRLVAASAKADANVTIQVGNVSSGAQIVGSVALTTGTLTALTVAQLKPTTVNAWSNASTAANITYSLVYERDDIV